jgi:hypothetical protein
MLLNEEMNEKSGKYFFDDIIPINEEDTLQYMKTVKYRSPLIELFRKNQQNLKSRWNIEQPKTSFSVFPPHVVVALPTIRNRFDQEGAFNTPFMEIDNDITDGASPATRYNLYKAAELTRLQKRVKNDLIHIIQRKVKVTGARYSFSGTIQKIAGLIFECDFLYFGLRLSQPVDNDRNELVRSIFDGGARLGLTPSSVVATIADVPIMLKSVRSFSCGVPVDSAAIDALQALFASRDARLFTAFHDVNNGKKNYKRRQPTLYLESKVVNTLFDTALDHSKTMEHPQIKPFVENNALFTSYRVVAPYYITHKEEWMLVIIDNYSRQVSFVFPRYARSDLSPSTLYERISLYVAITDKIKDIFNIYESSGEINPNNTTQTLKPWAYEHYDQDIPLTKGTRNRTPEHMPHQVSFSTDSGLYVAYAIECDYFDAPIYAQEEDWMRIRGYFAYCILNNDVPLT